MTTEELRALLYQDDLGRDRFPAEIISHAVWLYFRFTLSYFRSCLLLHSGGDRGVVVLPIHAQLP
jgi:transposase-like protein